MSKIQPWDLPGPQVALCLPQRLVVGVAVGGAGRLPFPRPDYMVARGMGNDVDPAPGRPPAMPAQEQILRALALVAVKIRQRQGPFGQEGAAQPAPVAGEHGPDADGRVGVVQPATAPPFLGV